MCLALWVLCYVDLCCLSLTLQFNVCVRFDCAMRSCNVMYAAAHSASAEVRRSGLRGVCAGRNGSAVAAAPAAAAGSAALLHPQPILSRSLSPLPAARCPLPPALPSAVVLRVTLSHLSSIPLRTGKLTNRGNVIEVSIHEYFFFTFAFFLIRTAFVRRYTQPFPSLPSSFAASPSLIPSLSFVVLVCSNRLRSIRATPSRALCRPPPPPAPPHSAPPPPAQRPALPAAAQAAALQPVVVVVGWWAAAAVHGRPPPLPPLLPRLRLR
jgi:hypothetical protein